MLSFFPLDVLDEIWDVIESVSKGFLTYSCICIAMKCYGNKTVPEYFIEQGITSKLLVNVSVKATLLP